MLYFGLRLTGRFAHGETFRALIWFYGRCWVTLVACFVPVSLPKKSIPSPCVITVNHASFFDVYFMGGQPNWNTAIAVRQWPFKIPFYKPFMVAAEYIRTEGRCSDDIIDESVRLIKKGATVLYFPEGSRSRGPNLQRFYSGAFKTAMEADVPIVPLCLHGTQEFLRRGHWILKPSSITVSLLPPVYPTNYVGIANPHIAMRKDVKQRMTKALKKMSQKGATLP